MPVIKSAIKKLRRDKKVTVANNALRAGLDRALRLAKKQKTAKTVQAAMSHVDRAVKNNLMHKNRAARIKSSLSKLAKPTAKAISKSVATAPKVASKTIKKAAKKTTKVTK